MYPAALSPPHAVVPAKAGTHRAANRGLWNMDPRLRGDDTAFFGRGMTPWLHFSATCHTKGASSHLLEIAPSCSRLRKIAHDSVAALAVSPASAFVIAS